LAGPNRGETLRLLAANDEVDPQQQNPGFGKDCDSPEFTAEQKDTAPTPSSSPPDAITNIARVPDEWQLHGAKTKFAIPSGQ
jgi:hypothetical protein